MDGLHVYGLSAAKRICRDVRGEVKGENGIYAKGFRDALRHVESDIMAKIDEIKAANLALKE